MKRKIKRYLLAICLCWTLSAGAQTRLWTLEECIRHATENNIDLKQKLLEQESREIEMNTARNSWLPNLNAGLGQNFDFGRSPSKDGVIVDRNSANSSAYLQASIPLFDGFKIPNTIAARKLDLRAAVESFNKAKDDLAISIASYYLQALYYKEILHIAELHIALTSEQVAQTEALVNTGKVPLSQLYDIKAQRAKDEVTRTEARNNVTLALLNLAQLLELERGGDGFDIAVPDLQEPAGRQTADILSPELVYWNAVAVKPQIKEQEWLLGSRKKMLKVTQAGYYPQLNLNLSYSNGYYYYSGASDIVNVRFNDQLRQNERKTIGFSLTVPIFNRFEVRNSVRSARVAIISQELAMENTKKTLYKEIQQAYFNATSAQEKYTAATQSAEAGREAFKYAEERYATGRSTVFEYNESKTRYAQSLSEQAQAKYDFIFRTGILDFYNGKPITLPEVTGNGM
ncbi:MAG: TolC family protein [Tannerellaceae bacterium]|jgi:outer membrane protein|nr:TolC family protein [Tannerellaceae bacterium]